MKIKVITLLPNEEYEVKEINNNYDELSNFARGMIDMPFFPLDDEITILCNDNYLNNGMQYHASLLCPEYKHIFCGPLMFLGYDPETGDSISLTDTQINKVIDYINKNQVYGLDARQAYNLMMSNLEKKEKGDLHLC